MGAATVVAYTEAGGDPEAANTPLAGALDTFPPRAHWSLIAKLERVAAVGTAPAVGFVEASTAEGVLVVWCRHGRRIYCVLCAVIDRIPSAQDARREDDATTAVVLLHATAFDEPTASGGQRAPGPASDRPPLTRARFASAAAAVPAHDPSCADALPDLALPPRSLLTALPEDDLRLAADRLTRFRHAPERHGWA